MGACTGKGWDNGPRIHFLGCRGLWVLELMQLFLFCLILKTLGTSANYAAKFVRVPADKLIKIINVISSRQKTHIEQLF